MQYEKPEVVVLGSPVDAIQGMGKFNSGNPDNPPKCTIAAYEADE
jgi:hypothetical protein